MLGQRILDAFPNHKRAKLFMQDAQASSNMYYDEEAQKKRDRLSQVLGVPVTDFELSVRSRNCLQKMGIFTLGDLARCSEQELLASKNFGETSLDEIREMLTSKGLQLGQLAHEKDEPEPDLDRHAGGCRLTVSRQPQLLHGGDVVAPALALERVVVEVGRFRAHRAEREGEAGRVAAGGGLDVVGDVDADGHRQLDVGEAAPC